MIKLKQGVSLIVLVITIAIMLIIASVVLMNLESNNIINSAEETVDKSNLSVTKEKIEILASRELLETQTTKLTQTGLDTRLKTEFGENNYELYNAEEFYIVKHNDKSFKVYPNSEVEEYLEGEIVIIDSIEDLVRFREHVNGGGVSYKNITVVQIKDLDFNSDASYDNTSVTISGVEYKLGGTNDLKTHLTTGSGWYGIGTDTCHFDGLYDGTNKKVENIYINTSKPRQGLFSWVNGSIKNVILTGEMTTSSYCIGLVAEFRGKIIEHCINYANITSTLLNHNGAAVGGIVGYNNGKIINCENYGTITASSNCVGGVTGVNYYLVKNCANNGIMKFIGTGRSAAGGIVGYNINSANIAVVEKCINTGDIESKMYSTGGIVGNNPNGIIRLSCNYGNITNTVDSTGGIAGTSGTSAKTENCYNIGKVSGRKYTGGILGTNCGKITYAYNIGSVTGNEEFGGVVGTIADTNGVVYGSVGNSYYLDTSVANGTALGTSKTEKEMKTRDFAKLLGITNWKYVEVKNNGYPVLSWQ